jgi:hypothetical protein
MRSAGSVVLGWQRGGGHCPNRWSICEGEAVGVSRTGCWDGSGQNGDWERSVVAWNQDFCFPVV